MEEYLSERVQDVCVDDSLFWGRITKIEYLILHAISFVFKVEYLTCKIDKIVFE